MLELSQLFLNMGYSLLNRHRPPRIHGGIQSTFDSPEIYKVGTLYIYQLLGAWHRAKPKE